MNPLRPSPTGVLYARPRVFITQPVAQAAVERLAARASVVWNEDDSRPLPKRELMLAVKEAEYLFCMLHDLVDAEVIAAAPRLRMIACMGPGVGIDIEAASRRRIAVTTGHAAVAEPPGRAGGERSEQMALFVANNILDVIEGRRPQKLANPSIYQGRPAPQQ